MPDLADSDADGTLQPAGLRPASREVRSIRAWLIEQALDGPTAAAIMEQFCLRLREAGVPIGRGRVIWPTLHPLFAAETVLWQFGEGISSNPFVHQDRDSPEWKRSPAKWMIEEGKIFFRRRLDEGQRPHAFPVLEELEAEGYTDFIATFTPIFGEAVKPVRTRGNFGLYVTWSTREPGGFSDADVEALRQLRQLFALVLKSAIQPRLTANIANTYLGPTIAREVLSGQIQLGSGRHTRSLVWYSDLRNSTHFAETLIEADFLHLLNDYFDCVARPAVEAGGEVLAFIGDAVLAIFPLLPEEEEHGGSLAAASRAATGAAAAALVAAKEMNERRAAKGQSELFFGIAMTVGDVRLGNIGIPQRLSFSVIGPAVNEAARIEKMTKSLPSAVLATKAVTCGEPEAWRSIGTHALDGLQDPVELFAFSAAR